MDNIDVCSSTLSFCRSPLEKGYNIDDMNDKGAFNYSCICIVPTDSLVEPSGWFSGRRYYVVVKGRSVGVFHELTKVHQSVDPFPSASWKTCATWDEAVRFWDSARRSGSIKLLRADEGQNATASAAGRSSPPSPSPAGVRRRAPASRTAHTAHGRTPVSLGKTRSNNNRRASPDRINSAKPQPPPIEKQPRKVIIISDDSDFDNGGTSDSEIETTSPKPIKKLIDCYEWSEGEDDLRKTYDAATNTFLHKSNPGKTAPSPPAASGSAHPDSAPMYTPSRHGKPKPAQSLAKTKGRPQSKAM